MATFRGMFSVSSDISKHFQSGACWPAVGTSILPPSSVYARPFPKDFLDLVDDIWASGLAAIKEEAGDVECFYFSGPLALPIASTNK